MNSRVRDPNGCKIFEFWAEIRPSTGESPASGQIVSSFPESFKDEKVLNELSEFCFPCEFEKRTVQIFSFVLTNIDSKWRFGFCRHDPKTDVAMVLITYLPWHDIFIRFMNVLAEIKKTSASEFQTFLTEAYKKGVPEMGGCLKLYYDNGANAFLFQRPLHYQLPSIPENNNLNLYYNFVEPKFMIGVFAAMLAERRVIFTSRRLDVLSSCIQAAHAFLYPMVWQHIFIPVLPMKMKDILMAPMPFLIGVPQSVLDKVRSDEVGDVVILNCDNRTLQTPFDDVKDLPADLVHTLKKQLSNSSEHRGDRVSRIFLGILVQFIGGYRDAVKFEAPNRITFDREIFIESRPSHFRPFLTKMLELQIFCQFIDERLEMLNTGQGTSDEFELESCRQAEKLSRKSKKYKNLIKTVRTKTNPAVLSAVESVKESGRGMKTAFTDFKSRIRESSASSSSKSQLDYHHGASSFANSASNNGHSSAPSSPVNRRAQTMFIPESTYIRPKPLQTSTSSVNKTYKYYNNNNNNETLTKQQDVSYSPAVSPTSSSSNSTTNSSSDMNILQELQQQNVLFTSPVVPDRSLKPSSLSSATLDRTISRIGSPNHSLSPKIAPDFLTGALSNGTVAAVAPPAPKMTINLNLTGSVKHTQLNSLFDVSPVMPSPPVPPRQKQLQQQQQQPQQLPPSNCSHSTQQQSLSSTFKSLAIYKNNADITSNRDNLMKLIPNLNSQPSFLSSTSSSSSSTMALVAQSNPLIAHSNTQIQTMLPTNNGSYNNNNTDNKTKTSPNKLSKDLIELDTNSSYEIEDFDPLNDNAKPIPTTNLRSTTLPASVVSLNNPVYPYFQPTHMSHSTTETSTAKGAAFNDDNELLKTYGLDHFTIGQNRSSNSSSTTTNYSSTTTNFRTSSSASSNYQNAISNWTTFD